MHKKYIKYGWFENLDIPLMVTNNMCTPNINKYKVKAGSSLEAWEKVDGLQKQILMDGFSGIVTFLQVEEQKMIQDKQIDGSNMPVKNQEDIGED